LPSAVEFHDRERPEVLRRRPVALDVNRRHPLDHFREQVEAGAERHPGGELLEVRVAVPADLLDPAERAVELLAQLGRRAVGDEQVAVGVERGFPVAGPFGLLGDLAELGGRRAGGGSRRADRRVGGERGRHERAQHERDAYPEPADCRPRGHRGCLQSRIAERQGQAGHSGGGANIRLIRY
jgi:hypothetical protein